MSLLLNVFETVDVLMFGCSVVVVVVFVVVAAVVGCCCCCCRCVCCITVFICLSWPRWCYTAYACVSTNQTLDPGKSEGYAAHSGMLCVV